ncbi:MAG: NAD(P)H-dependent oxidoreductase [Opitutae bacterium]|nr:NAD(P)H-dependent oxidoreductase [Opitutae bacterium]
MKNKILLILGHSQNDSLCAALADSYALAARAQGTEVRELRLGQLKFDPVLAMGNRADQALEPDLQAAQEAIRWAEHIVLVYPNWWGSMPALLKGFLDRVMLPGFAFKYRQDSMFWDRLLAGRSADLIVTMDTPPLIYRWLMRAPGIAQVKDGILGFCGIKPVRVTLLGPVRTASVEKRSAWLQQVSRLAAA